MADGIELKVAEALSSDVERGIARVDSRARKTLDITTGDYVEIKGKTSVAAQIWPAHEPDEGLNIIRIDSLIRHNAGVALGDKIFLKKVELKDAVKVVLAPFKKSEYSPGFDQYIKQNILGRPFAKGNQFAVRVFGSAFPFQVASVQPQGIVLVKNTTQLELMSEPMKDMGKIADITYENIGGLKEEIQKIREMVELPMRHPRLFEQLGIEPPKGVLIYGPPGTGKTLLAKAVANESTANFIHIAGPELVSKFVGDSEEKLRQLFKEAEENAPTIIFMDEIDAIAPKRGEVVGEVERRMVSQLLTLMDGLKSRGQVIVIGATNRPNALDEALRRPGRFDREIEIGVPNRTARKEILQIHTRHMPIVGSNEDKEKLIDELASITHGYTGADISLLTKEAAMKTLRRILPDINLKEDVIPPHVFNELKVTRDDFMRGLAETQPSALREVFLEVPNVRWSDIGGLADVKKVLKEAVELPLKNPEVFTKMGIRPLRGLLLVGLPGTGKTLFAKAVATESEANFISVKGPAVISKWVGQTEMVVHELFRKARSAAPCIIFIDEIDAIASMRGMGEGTSHTSERVVNSLLTELDGVQNLENVVVLAATNRPDILDPALLRPGRFDRIIEIPPPDLKTRVEIFKVHTKKMPLAEGVDIEALAKATDNYTGADIEGICREAGMAAIRANAEKITMHHFEHALKTMRPTISKEKMQKIKEFAEGPTGAMYG